MDKKLRGLTASLLFLWIFGLVGVARISWFLMEEIPKSEQKRGL